eukprot:gene29697-36788_t
MSDCLIFAVLFATYAVLGRNYAGGPTGAELFDLKLVALNTSMLLLSSITYGFAMLEAARKRLGATMGWLVVTGLFGAAFLGLELYEFMHLLHENAGPQRSAFLTSFWALVATHGLHVTFGLVWLITLLFQLKKHGLTHENMRRMTCLSISAMSDHNHDHHGHDDHGHGHHGHDDHNHGSLKSYTIGFILSVILTAIPFWLVMGNVFANPATTAFTILGFAAVQIVVHMVYFLHMNAKVEGGWSMLAMMFTLILVVIVLADAQHAMMSAPRGPAEQSAATGTPRLRSAGLRYTLVACAALVIAVLLALGTWQVQRLQWKLALIERVNARVHAEPVPAPGPQDWAKVSAETDEYKHVHLTGVLLPEYATKAQATTERGPGYWLLTPLCLADGSNGVSIVMINRGFLPLAAAAIAWQCIAAPDRTVGRLTRAAS